MRVCIDVMPLLVRSAGVKNYLYHWTRHLRKLAGGDSVALFPPLELETPLNHQHSLASPIRTWAGLGSLALINYAHLPLIDWFGARADIFHTTNLLQHPPRRMLLTTTVHDVTTWMMPGWHSGANRRADRNFERILRSARGIIAVSESTRSDVVRLLGVNPERITVIHSGVPDAFFQVTPAKAKEARRAYALDRPYALFLGTIEPRKNVRTLLQAWQSLSADITEQFDLVIAGPAGWGERGLLAHLASPSPGIRYLGYIPERHLAGLTAGATAFVYPSLYEGFGFPVAQAMAAGVPVVTSNTSSLPEVAGDAALLVDPRSPSELRDVLAHLLLSPVLRQQLSAAGRARAKCFTWDECARKSLTFFREIRG